jgi:conjugative transfer signal peptidase TraF
MNFTPSMPVGLWRISKKVVVGEALRHKAVLFCPPDTEIFRWARSQDILSPGRCPGGYTPLLKEVVGLPGDEIETNDASVVFNGHRLASSVVLPIGWPISKTSYEVPVGTIWVMGSLSIESFDSRYFGPISVDKAIGVAEPILTFR